MPARRSDPLSFCLRALAGAYGAKRAPARRSRPPALDELILTVLSQNTNDRNRDRAYRSLRQRFPGWEDVLAAPTPAIVAAIRVGGLAEQKARRIQALLTRVKETDGSLSLERLCAMPQEEARNYLLSFKGVGDKTAACVLLFSCGRPVFPVDTHILRVSQRLGLIPEKASAKQAHELLDARVPDDRKYEFHLNLIAHGRAVCHARKPECTVCCLKSKCRYFQRMKSKA